MKRIFGTASIGAVSMLFSVTFAQQYNITGAGARAEGFGGAFIGVADDATAVVWNPAGLSQLQRPEASVVARLVGESADFKDRLNATNNQSTSLSHTVFNFGSLALPFKIGGTNVVVAAAYQRQLDFYDSYKQSGYEYEEKGGVDTFTPGVGVELSPLFSLGFATNIWFGKDEYAEKNTPATTSNPNLNYNGSPKGLNFVFGAMLDFGGMQKPLPLKIGASVRTPFTLNSDYTYQWTPALLGVVPEAKTTSKSDMPLMIGFGGSYRIGENLTVAADYELRSYGKSMTIVTYNVAGYSIPPDTTQLSASKKDLNQFRIGAEYLLVLDAGVFPVRVGYHNVPTLLAYRNASGASTDQQVIGDGFSIGTGYISEKFALDLTFSRASYQAGGVNSTTDYAQTTFTGSIILYF